MMEIEARNGKIIAIAEESENNIDQIADDVIRVPDTRDELASIPASVAMQLLAYSMTSPKSGAPISTSPAILPNL